MLQGAIKASGKLSLEGRTGLAWGVPVQTAPCYMERRGQGHPGLSQKGGCMHAGGQCSFTAPARCRSAAEGAGGDGALSRMTLGRGQPSTSSESRMRLGLKHQLETENAVLGSPGILPCDPPELARLLGGHPEHPAPRAMVPQEPGRGEERRERLGNSPQSRGEKGNFPQAVH